MIALRNTNKHVPRSLVISQGTLLGGMGRSWLVPVFILNGHFPDGFPQNEEPVPFDGNPHPINGAEGGRTRGHSSIARVGATR